MAALSFLPGFEGRLIGAGVEGVGDRDVGVVGEVEVEVHVHWVVGEGIEWGWRLGLRWGAAVAIVVIVVVVGGGGIVVMVVVILHGFE